jgi:hypothetical protein
MADNVQLPGTGQIIAAKADPSGVDHQEVILANTAFQDVNPATSDNQAELVRDLTTTEKDGSLAEDSGITVADLLLKAMDKNEQLPLQVQLPKDLKQEPDGGLYVADMKGPYIWQSSTASQQLIIDCTGFKSVLVHKITTGIVTPSVSNDGKTWSATLAVAVSTTTPATTILTAAGMYILPVVSKYLQLVGPASAIQCFIYLSQAPCVVNSSLNNVPMNVTQYGGYNVVTAGVNGMAAIGGNIASGTAPTANPVLMAGADGLAVPLTRRVLTDVLGRIQIGNIPSQRTTGVNILGFDPSIRNILEVQDTSVAEGMEMDEVMVQVLFELRILNQQMYELPRLLRDGLQNVDQPEDFRDDMGVFNQ